MITNDRQRRITAAQIRRFEQSAEHARASAPSGDVDRRLHEAMIAGIESQLNDLRAELNEYEALRHGKVKSRTLHSLLDLPDALIEGRITLGLTQKQLAQRIGIPEQQIQRYEQTRYSGASLERLQQAVDAVGLTISKRVAYPVAATTAGKGGPAKRKARANATGSRTKRSGATRTKRKATGTASRRRAGSYARASQEAAPPAQRASGKGRGARKAVAGGGKAGKRASGKRMAGVRKGSRP